MHESVNPLMAGAYDKSDAGSPKAKKGQPLPLYVQLTVLVIVVLTGSIAIIVYQTVRHETQALSQLYKVQTQALAKNIAVLSRDYFPGRDFSPIEELISQTRIPWNLDMTVLDKNGKILKKVIVGSRDFVTPNYDNKLFTPPERFQSTKENRFGWSHIWEPVVDEKPLGWIRMSYSLKLNKNLEKRIWKQTIENGLPVIFGAVTLLLIFLWRPIKAIRNATDFALRLDELKGDTIPIDRGFLEVYLLCSALNHASLKLTSQEQSLTQSAERLRSVVNELESQKHALDQHAIVSVVDVHGNISYINDKFCEVSGFDREELIGYSQLIQYPDDYPEAFFESLWQTIAQGKIWHGELKQRKQDGSYFWADTTIVPFLDNKGIPYKYYMIRTDISGRKSAERQLQEKNEALEMLREGLEEEVNQRTKELKKANEELERLNQVKSEFISIVSHELRTPLTSIKSFSEILYDDVGEMDVDTQRRYLSIIDKESDRLGRLISDVLDLQKIDSGKIIWKEDIVDLVTIIEDCVETVSTSNQDSEVDVVCEIGVEQAHVMADPDKITQVVTNLLSNAIKFTDDGSVKVKLERKIHTGGEEKEWFRIRIKDTGIGIPDDELSKIFNRFHQVDSSQTRARGGSGLGLSICKEIVEHYDGYIDVTSHKGKGSEFWVDLPVYVEKKKIGEILLEQGVVTTEQLDAALRVQE